MARQKPKAQPDAAADEKPKGTRQTGGDKGLIVKLVVLLVVVVIAVSIGAYFHEKQSAEPLGYEYFKKRGYDKIKTLEPDPVETPEEEQDAKIKAQRNIFLQD